MNRLAIIGCGYVADLYMDALRAHPEISVAGAYDINPERAAAFCAHWNIPPLPSAEAAHAAAPLILNLTNPAAHYAVSRAALEAGCHVYSEKPLATELDKARELVALAAERGLQIAAAPCSVLAPTAQTLWRAVRGGAIGRVRLVYAELDDGYIPQAPYRLWRSASGAPWPWEDEFRTGCTVEHAGYALSWLCAMFGPVRTLVAASAELVPEKLPRADADGSDPAAADFPDFSTATLFFESGTVARLTNSIVAPHDHGIRLIGEGGTLRVDESWNNTAPVRLHRRLSLRRRLIDPTPGRRLPLVRGPHPAPRRKGAAAMDFALGPAEMLEAIAAGRPARLSGAFALHITEVTLAIHNARSGAIVEPESRFEPMTPMPWAGG